MPKKKKNGDMASNLPSLYTIAEDYRVAFDELKDIEDDDAVKDTLDAISQELEVKADNCIAYVEHLDMVADKLKEIEKRRSDEIKRLKRESEKIKNYVKDCMDTAGIRSIETDDFRLTIAKNPPKVSVETEVAVPEDYWVEKTEIRLDKTSIKNDMKAGKEVPGCRLIQDERLKIS